ncbi:MAG: ABC transporter ATP-binding protein [Clostridiaceae bacterium]
MKAIIFLLKKIKTIDPKMLLMVAVYSVMAGIMPFLWVYLPSRIITLVSEGKTDSVIPLILVFGVVAIIFSFSISFITGNYRMRMNNIRYALIREVIEFSLNMPFESTLDKEQLEKITSAKFSVSGPMHGAGGIILKLLNTLGLIFALIGFIWIFTTLPWYVLLLILISTGISAYINIQLMKLIYVYWTSVIPISHKAEKLIYEFRNPLSKQDIIIYNFIGLFKSYFKKQLDLQNIALKAHQKKVQFQMVLFSTVNLVKEFGVYLWLIFAFINGQIDISRLYFLMTSMMGFLLISDGLVLNVTSIKQDVDMFNKFIELMDTKFEKDGDLIPDTVNDWEITFDDVTFNYPGKEEPVLKNVSFKINKLESLALVGENGSGKTTIVLLLCRLFKPTSGRILLNGVDIQNLIHDEYLKYVSVIFQDSMVLPVSIKENITYSEDEASGLEEVYEKSGMDKVLLDLEKSDEQTLLRILDDDGIDLSGGQLQKLYLARALYKKDSKLLILDEPTAALDALAEGELYKSYADLTRDKASLFISHRLASTQFCDRIIYLRNGQIIEEGTHKELIAKQGEYFTTFEIQAKHYREVEHEKLS